MKGIRTGLLLVLALLVGLGLGLAKPFVIRPELVVGQDAVVAGAGASATVDDVGGRVVSIMPASGMASKVLILYPGALVRPQAYEWLGHALAPAGVQTVIPEFPFDMAFTDAGRAERLILHYGQGRPVVLAGHSLGGAMAASFADDHPDRIAGLILMAAYPADNISLDDVPKPALVLQAELDGVAAAEKVAGSLGRMPGNTNLVVIHGAVHSFFGRYGPQAGDGMPTVTRAEAEGQIASVVSDFLSAIR